MAVGAGAEIKVAFRYTYLDQKCENVQSYICQGIAFATASMPQILEALWNDYKARLRAITSTSSAVGTFDSLFGIQIGGALEFAEFAVPDAERPGSRALGNDGLWLTGIVAAGARQTVATRVTRPGQKRFPWLRRDDISGNVITPAIFALYTPIFTAFSEPSALGIPVLGGALQPIIVHEPGVRDPVRHVQDVIGFVQNTDVTSQVSRKRGHGN